VGQFEKVSLNREVTGRTEGFGICVTILDQLGIQKSPAGG
jgi:hypothetical protein